MYCIVAYIIHKWYVCMINGRKLMGSKIWLKTGALLFCSITRREVDKKVARLDKLFFLVKKRSSLRVRFSTIYYLVPLHFLLQTH